MSMMLSRDWNGVRALFVNFDDSFVGLVQVVFGSPSIFEIIQDIAKILQRFLRILQNLSHPNSILLLLQEYDIAKKLGKIRQENSSLSIFPHIFF